jgi:hypothetical protein
MIARDPKNAIRGVPNVTLSASEGWPRWIPRDAHPTKSGPGDATTRRPLTRTGFAGGPFLHQSDGSCKT